METQFENLQVELDGRIAVIAVNRPAVLNALNAATLREIDAAFRSAAEDDGVGGVILTGSGEKAFVAGADINELKELGPMQAREVAALGQRLFLRIERLGKPVIAAINGFALGGGLELASACTFRTASSNAVLGLPEVKLGIIPGYGGTQRLPRLVGIGRAMELILTGEPVKADMAERMGLVNHVYEPAELLPETKKLMGKILARGPLAVRSAMEAGFRGMDVAIEDGLALESALFGVLASTEDMAEGMTAFVEKRNAEFKGR